jgi:hypothetical protein
MALELRQNMSSKELSLPFEKVGYAADADDPKLMCSGAERLVIDVFEARMRRRAAVRRNKALHLRVNTTLKEQKLRRSQIGAKLCSRD